MKKQVTGDFLIPIDRDDLESYDGKDYLRVMQSLKFNSSLDNDKLDRLIKLLELFRDYRNDEELNAIFQLGNTHCSVEFRQGFKGWARFSKQTAVLRREGKFVETGGLWDNALWCREDDEVVRPLEDGKILDPEASKYLVREMAMQPMNENYQDSEISKMLMIVPATFSTLEIALLREALQETVAKDIRFIYRPLAEAICLGYDIYEPEAKMIVHCGGGVTEISVIALGGIVASKTIPFAGKLFTQKLCKYLLDKYKIIVDDETAKRAKVEIISTITAKQTFNPIEISGVSPVTNRSKTITINFTDIEWALDGSTERIEKAVLEVLGNIPSEMVYDIICKTKRIVLTGDSAGIPRLDKRINNAVTDYYSKFVVTDAEGNRVSYKRLVSDFDVLVELNPISHDPFLELMHFDRFDFLIK